MLWSLFMMQKSYHISFRTTAIIVLLFLPITKTNGFIVFPLHRLATSRTIPTTTSSTSLFLSKYDYDSEGKHLTFNPFDGYQSVDIERAKECVENFGTCSTAEMEKLRANLHKERLQSFVFGGSTDALEHYVLEEELEMQLALLNDHHSDSSESSLFPTNSHEVTEASNSWMTNVGDETHDNVEHRDDEANGSLFPTEMKTTLPHINDKKQEEHHENPFHLPTTTEVLAIEETMVEENAIEPFLFCAVLAAFMFLPQISDLLT